MAVVFPRTGWTNADGLRVWFGTAEAVLGFGGEYSEDGPLHCVEYKVDLATVAASTTNQYVLDTTVVIPAGSFIEKVVVIPLTETTGVNANLDLGLIDQDLSTEHDFNGLLAAADAFNGGTDVGVPVEYVKGTTEAGALLGTRITNAGLVCANAETAVFTAGVLLIRIYFSTNTTSVAV
jgi:hypothetical protein